MIQIIGTPISGGLVHGPAFIFKKTNKKFDEILCLSPETEWSTLKKGIRKIQKAFSETVKATDDEGSSIYQASTEMLEDPELLKQVHDLIFNDNKSASFALWQTVCVFSEALIGTQDPVICARAEDLKGIARQVLEIIDHHHTQDDMPSTPSIIVAEDLNISDILKFKNYPVLGYCLKKGNLTDHTAIIIKAYGIPAIFGLGDQISSIKNGQEIWLDSDSGTITLAPTKHALTQFRTKAQTIACLTQMATEESHHPAETSDGQLISILANITDHISMQVALENHADGIGLIRSEFQCFTNGTIPDEESQTTFYSSIVKAFREKPVTLRLFDFGGDKIPASLKLMNEANPFLGQRGIRLSRENEHVFRIQIRAALKASVHGCLKLLIPMVTTKNEVLRLRAILDQAKQELEHGGWTFPYPIGLGIMVETPASAFIIDQLAEHVDFLSIGSNDLTQYIMAADRSNPAVSDFVDSLAPAVLRIIRHIVQEADERHLPLSICGEIASDITAVPLLIGLGIRCLSVAPGNIPLIKKLIRSLSMPRVSDLSKKALQLTSSQEIKQLFLPLLTDFYAKSESTGKPNDKECGENHFNHFTSKEIIMKKEIKIAAGMAHIDYGHLFDIVKQASDAGADYIHSDAADMHDLKNMQLMGGYQVIQGIRSATSCPIECHIYTETCDRLFIEKIAGAGTNMLVLPAEHFIGAPLAYIINDCRKLHLKIGLTIGCYTPLSFVEESINDIDRLNIVIHGVDETDGQDNWGWRRSALDLLRRARKLIDEKNPDCELSIDGGIRADNLEDLIRCQPDVVVCSSAIFKHPNGIAAGVASVRDAINNAIKKFDL